MKIGPLPYQLTLTDEVGHITVPWYNWFHKLQGNLDTLPTIAGAPTAVPKDIPSGRVAAVYDTTNNKLWVYNGAWKGVVLS